MLARLVTVTAIGRSAMVFIYGYCSLVFQCVCVCGFRRSSRATADSSQRNRYKPPKSFMHDREQHPAGPSWGKSPTAAGSSIQTGVFHQVGSRRNTAVPQGRTALPAIRCRSAPRRSPTGNENMLPHVTSRAPISCLICKGLQHCILSPMALEI
jgi:hypothetical protein